MSKEKTQVVEVPLELHQKTLNTLLELPIKYSNLLAPIINELQKCNKDGGDI